MSNKLIAILVALFVGTFTLSAQNSLQDLQKELTKVDLDLTDLEKKKIELEKRIKDFDFIGWKFGGAGAANFSLAGSNGWYNAGLDQASLGGTVNLFANNNQDKWFWNNWGNLKLIYINNNLDLDIPDLPDGTAQNNWEKSIDELYLATLYGYKLSPVLAASVMADARTTFGNFFDNAIITVGVGITYKPNADLTVVFHPLSYKGIAAKSTAVKEGFEFKDIDATKDGDLEFIGEFGVKAVVDYKRELARNLVWTTNLTAFAPYSDFGNIEATWLNSFGYKFNDWMNISLNYDFRYYKPETYSIYRTAFPLAADGTAWADNDAVADAIDANDDFGFVQRRWGVGVGVTTTFDLTRMPSLPIIGK